MSEPNKIEKLLSEGRDVTDEIEVSQRGVVQRALMFPRVLDEKERHMIEGYLEKDMTE